MLDAARCTNLWHRVLLVMAVLTITLMDLVMLATISLVVLPAQYLEGNQKKLCYHEKDKLCYMSK